VLVVDRSACMLFSLCSATRFRGQGRSVRINVRGRGVFSTEAPPGIHHQPLQFEQQKVFGHLCPMPRLGPSRLNTNPPMLSTPHSFKRETAVACQLFEPPVPCLVKCDMAEGYHHHPCLNATRTTTLPVQMSDSGLPPPPHHRSNAIWTTLPLNIHHRLSKRLTAGNHCHHHQNTTRRVSAHHHLPSLES